MCVSNWTSELRPSPVASGLRISITLSEGESGCEKEYKQEHQGGRCKYYSVIFTPLAHKHPPTSFRTATRERQEGVWGQWKKKLPTKGGLISKGVKWAENTEKGAIRDSESWGAFCHVASGQLRFLSPDSDSEKAGETPFLYPIFKIQASPNWPCLLSSFQPKEVVFKSPETSSCLKLWASGFPENL